MVSFESMRSWRRQSSAGAFSGGAAVVLLLWLSLVQSGSAQSVCPAAQTPQNLTQPVYHEQPEAEESFMKALVRSFLNTVQPRDFPIELITTIIEEATQGTVSQKLIRDAALYEVGFAVCAIIGILYIVLMPIVGLFVACCRCCGNCGGKMYQKQSSSIHCRRRTLYWCTFAITGIILAGNICMFISNNNLKTSYGLVLEELNNTIDNTNTYLSAVPQQIRDVEVGAYDTIDEVDGNLKDIGPQLGAKIQQQFEQVLNPVVQSVESLDKETVRIDDQINELDSSLVKLQNNVSTIQADLAAAETRIKNIFAGCTSSCGETPPIPDLTLDTTTFTQNLKDLQSAVNEVKATNVSSKIQEEKETYFNTIPETVTNETREVVQKGQKQLYEIKVQIRDAIEQFPIDYLNSTSDTLDQIKEDVGRVTPTLKFAELTRWRVCLALCCTVLLVVVCNLLGLMLGPLGLKPKADPKKRSCTADCGGIFFMIGAGFSFLYSWLLMIIVLVLFLLGGNTYTLVCEPWNDGQLLKLIDTPGLIPDFNISDLLGLKTDITVSDIYNDCKANQTLWTTLHLNDIVNLDELFNVSDILQDFESPNISLSTINLLSNDVKDQLSSFSTNANKFDPTSITQEINNITSINLTTTAVLLEKLADDQTNIEIQNQLREEAEALRKIQSMINTIINPQLVNLNTSVGSLQSTVWTINGTVGEVLRNVDTTQNVLDTNTSQIVQSESQAFLDCQVEQFTVYADWATLAITEQLGRCGPVARAVDTSEIVFCANWLESLNAFWFSFGWCLIFFIPSIIFSMKLAKHYRKMKHSDVYDDHIIMNPIPRAQVKYA